MKKDKQMDRWTSRLNVTRSDRKYLRQDRSVAGMQDGRKSEQACRQDDKSRETGDHYSLHRQTGRIDYHSERRHAQHFTLSGLYNPCSVDLSLNNCLINWRSLDP